MKLSIEIDGMGQLVDSLGIGQVAGALEVTKQTVNARCKTNMWYMRELETISDNFGLSFDSIIKMVGLENIQEDRTWDLIMKSPLVKEASDDE